MTESTSTLLNELVRHARGMLASFEKWIAQERKKQDFPAEKPSDKDQLPA